MGPTDKREKATRPLPRGSRPATTEATEAAESLEPFQMRESASPPPAGAIAAAAPHPAADPVTDLHRWARGIGAEPRVSVPDPTSSGSRPSTARGGSTPPPRAPSPGQAGARYALESPLGRGGVGEVDLVIDRDLGRRVAKKRLRAELRSEPLLVRAFLEEAMIAGALEHPGIVPVHDIGVSPEEGPWYTMKRLQGEPLSTILSRLRGAHRETLHAWPLPRLVEVFVQVLRAVAHAHERGVVHCDLKPGNVLVGELGEVVVVDWGLAKVLGEGGKDQARASLWSGSPGYMPPEQATSEDTSLIDTRADIWALGAILYELVTLVVPQAEPDGTVPEPPTDGTFPPLVPIRRRAAVGPYRREVPPALATVCERALASRPDDRYDDVRLMLADVDQWLQGTRERERREARITAAAAAADRVLALGVGDPEIVEQAVAQIVDTLREAPGRPELEWRGSSLYWRIFRGLHLGELGRERATTLLDRLADTVVPAPEGSGERGAGDIGPWLEALDEVAADAPQVRALASRLRALHAAPLFSSLGGHELLPVASAVEVRKVKAGGHLVSEGEPGDALWVLVSGRVHVEAGGQRLTTMQPPACFGEIALIDHAPRTASVIADTDVVALTLTADRFDGLVRRHGAIAMGVMRLLSERLRGATAREIAARGAH